MFLVSLSTSISSDDAYTDRSGRDNGEGQMRQRHVCFFLELRWPNFKKQMFKINILIFFKIFLYINIKTNF